MGVNSIRPEKFNYCPLVPRGLNKKEANISEQFLSSSETQGQLVGAGKFLNEREKKIRAKKSQERK